RRARDHRRQQRLRRSRHDGVRRHRRLLGRRWRVDRRVLLGHRLRARARRQQASVLSAARPDGLTQMRILVTGGAGFIGSAFERQTLHRYPSDEVTVLDKLTYAGNLANLEPVANDQRYRFVQGDIADAGAVQRALEECSAVVNFAAETHVDRSILEPDAFVKTDVLGTWTLAEAARAGGVARFLQVSTDEVYGAVLSGASTESDRLDPTSPYSAAKAGGELLVLAAWKTYGLPALVVRGANAYGPYQYPEKLIPLHVTNAIDDQPLPVYGDGQQRRQWTHVSDFAAGVDAALRQGEIGQVYN